MVRRAELVTLRGLATAARQIGIALVMLCLALYVLWYLLNTPWR